nr:hypothetical protein [Tanacetum cinerariifolium]
MGKSKKKSHKPKSKDTNQEKLYLLHMDLWGPMRVESVNGKKYILVIVDDYSRFTWVKSLRTKDDAPDFIIKFLKMIQVGISHETSVARFPQQNGVVERRNRTLIEAAGTIKNLGKLQLKADIGIFISYAPTKKAFRVYNRRTRRIIKTIHVDFDELTVMASEQSSSGPALHEMTPATISSGRVPKPTSSTSFVPPLRNDWDMLFQPLFNELLTPSPSVDLPAHEVIAPIDEVIAPEPAESTGLPSSTTVDQDAPSPIAHMGNDSYFGIPIPEVSFNQSSSTDSIHTVVHLDHQISQHNSKWIKDHPLKNIIGQLARPVSTRLQLHVQALFCYYDAFLTFVEPKTYKDALTQSCWIEAMQEELNKFERLQVWELVPRPDQVMVITLKWIYKVKLDELGVDTPMVEKSKLDEYKKGKPLIRHIIVGLWYPKDSLIALTAFADADHAGCQDTYRSTSSSLQFPGDTLISWSSKRQKSAAISSMEAEYIALSKHIDIRYHFIKEHVENRVIELYFVNTKYQLADIFTKALGRERIKFLINKLGMRSFTLETLKQLTDEFDE